MSEMVKRVATAMTTAAGVWSMDKPHGPDACPYEVLARAAIESMRELPAAMISDVRSAVMSHLWCDPYLGCEINHLGEAKIWREMIDAALEDGAAA